MTVFLVIKNLDHWEGNITRQLCKIFYLKGIFISNAIDFSENTDLLAKN